MAAVDHPPETGANRGGLDPTLWRRLLRQAWVRGRQKGPIWNNLYAAYGGSWFCGGPAAKRTPQRISEKKRRWDHHVCNPRQWPACAPFY